MNKRGKTSAFVMGLIAGILNMFLGIFVALYASSVISGFSYVGYMNSFMLYILLFFIIAVANLIGGSVVLGSRVAGGVLMILTGLPLLVLFIYGAIEYNTVTLFIPNNGAALAILIVFIIIELLSVIAAIIAFSGPKINDYYPYGHYYPGYGQLYQPYPGNGKQQPYQGHNPPNPNYGQQRPYQGQQPPQSYAQQPPCQGQQPPQSYAQKLPYQEDIKQPEPTSEQPQPEKTATADNNAGVTPDI